MKKKLCCFLLVLAVVLSFTVGVQASEEGPVCTMSASGVIASYETLDAALAAADENAAYYQLTADLTGGTIDRDILLDLNGYDLTGVTVAEGVTVRLMDSANDTYDASKCGSLSGTVNGTVEQLVKTTAQEVGQIKSYLVINQEGTYSAHRYYAGITNISLVPSNVALGYKAEYYADDVINAMVTGYGYKLWVNDYSPKQFIEATSIADHELTLRLKNILVENSQVISDIGATATISGNAIICFTVGGQELTVSGAEHSTTLQNAVEAVNTALGQNRSAYTEEQVAAVRTMCNTFESYMTTWEKEHILAVDKFSAVENVSVTYGDTLTVGQLFTAIEGAEYPVQGADVTVTAEGVEVTYGANTDDWTQGTVTFNGAGTAVVTITDNDFCIPTVNTVTVAKADPSCEIPTGLTATYGQTLENVTLPAGFTWKDANVSVGDAGTNSFTAVYTPADTVNYNTVEVTVSVEVAKADPTVTAPTGLTATYGDSLSSVALPEGFTWVDSGLSVGNAGTQTHTAVYNAGENYNTVEVTLTVEVAKANPTYTVPTGLTATEGDTLAAVTLPAGFSWKDSGLSVGNAGTNSFTAVYTPSDTANYNTVEVQVSVEVSAKVVEITDKFAQKMPAADFTYRLGNGNTVALSSLFKAIDGAEIDSANVNVTVAAVDGAVVSGTYTANTSDWIKGTIQFTGTGVVEITIQESYSNPLTLTFEVVNAKNATSAASATANNVVLLNDCGFSTLEVSNGFTLFGNGFTLSNPNDVTGDSMSSAYVTLDNGTLDNVQVICPNFSLSILYNSQASVDGNVDATAEWRYHNFRSAVTMNNNSNIYNSRISGGRAAVYVRNGYATLDNCIIEGGATANIHVSSAQQLTLRDMTLVQMPIQATVNDTSKKCMGFSVVITCDGATGSATPVVLEGYLHQYAWANESYKEYVPSGADSIISVVMNKTDYKHDISLNGDAAAQWLNLGIAYMPADVNQSAAAPDITDNRTDKDSIPYDVVDVTVFSTTSYVYSYKNSNRVGGEVEYIPVYEQPDAGMVTVPHISFADTGDGKVLTTAYDDMNGWMSELAIDLDTVGAYDFSFADLPVTKYGNSLDYTVTDASGNAVDKSAVINLSASGVYNYVLHIADNVDCNNAEGQSYTHDYHFTLTATMTSIAPPEKVAEVGGTPLLVVQSKDSDWSCAIPALEGTQIKYWSTTDKAYKTLVLSDLTPTSTGKQNGTNNYWTYNEPAGDYSLTVTCGVIHEGKGVYGMPVVVNNGGNKMYFTISSTNGYVSTGTSARTVTLSYEFKDNNGGTLTFSKTWQFNYADYSSGTQYSYDSFVNGTLEEAGDGGCVTPETLVTLADGSQVRVDSLTGAEELLVWNLETGKLDSAPIMFVDSETEAEYEIAHLYFSDGTDVKVIYEHGFWDYDLNRYVYLDANAAEYIGHTFAKQNGDSLEKVQLVDVVIENEITTAWSPVTAGHLCYFVNGMLSMPGGVGGLFNIFDVDAETMTYDYEAMARDIETYGLFTYEELNSIVALPEEMFEAAGGAYLKVSIGKGNLTMEELIAMIQRYTVYFQ